MMPSHPEALISIRPSTLNGDLGRRFQGTAMEALLSPKILGEPER